MALPASSASSARTASCCSFRPHAPGDTRGASLNAALGTTCTTPLTRSRSAAWNRRSVSFPSRSTSRNVRIITSTLPSRLPRGPGLSRQVPRVHVEGVSALCPRGPCRGRCCVRTSSRSCGASVPLLFVRGPPQPPSMPASPVSFHCPLRPDGMHRPVRRTLSWFDPSLSRSSRGVRLHRSPLVPLRGVSPTRGRFVGPDFPARHRLCPSTRTALPRREFGVHDWRGKPLRTFETIVDLIDNTRTDAGLRVNAELDTRKYPKGATAARIRRSRRLDAGDPLSLQPDRVGTINPP